jgi:hypothetical protein
MRCVPLGTATVGLLYLNGNRIDPPFQLTGQCTIAPDTTWHGFYINGYQIWKAPPPEAPLDTSGATVESRRLRAMFRAAQRSRELRESHSLPDGSSPAAALAAAYRADTAEVDSAVVLQAHSLDIYWRGERSPLNMQMEAGRSERPNHQQSMRQLLTMAQRILISLASDHIVLVEKTMAVTSTLPGGAVRRAWWAEQVDSLQLRSPGPLPPRGCEPK